MRMERCQPWHHASRDAIVAARKTGATWRSDLSAALRKPSRHPGAHAFERLGLTAAPTHE
jgi:hypothetical protein